MTRILTLLGLILLHSAPAFAQVTVTHGPVVGAVTSSSARITARLSGAGTLSFQLSTSPSFATTVGTVQSAAVDSNLFATIAVTGLAPNTEYFYRPVINGTPVTAASEIRRFRTAPRDGETTSFAFAFGSCQQDGDAPLGTSNIGNVFPRIARDNTIRFMLHLGDWGYPDTTDKNPNNPRENTFNLNFANVRNAFLARYSRTYQMDSVFRVMPVAYIWSDHDHANNNTDSTYNGPQHLSLRGYRAMFPHYPLADSNRGVWQRFRYGNAEFFLLDTRSTRSPNTNAFPNIAQWAANPLSVTNPNGVRLIFNPPSTHKIISDDQMAWLINGLRNSTAHWKFIVTSETFNPAHRAALELALSLQGVRGIDPLRIPDGVYTAAQIAIDISDGWCGFPESIRQLVSAVSQAGVQNVIVISGDSHTIGTDTGANSLFPEFMAGGLDQNNSEIVSLFEQFGIFVWNRARQSRTPGLGAVSNFRSHYGRVTVFGNDSVRVDYFDDQGTFLGSYTQPSGSRVATRNITITPQGFDYGNITVGRDSTAGVLLINTGIDTVTVSQVRNTRTVGARATPAPVALLNGTTPTPFPVAIPPRGLAILPVTFRPSTQGLNIDTLVFFTNDPDNLGLGAGIIPALFRANGQAASSVIEREDTQPRDFKLEQNYPNPFNPTTTIRYSIPSTQQVTLRIYDALGRSIITLVNERQSAGTYTVRFNAGDLASGVYFYQLQAGSFSDAKKMMLVK
ncbi:MAG: alkaline phosphatase D family protein [Chloroherpetonaceae bacterium]|nr:alkaline phosphatase D family protein [Chloroherpetonaceae bacterium]